MSKLVSELAINMSELFYAHLDWKPNGSIIDRKIKVDMEAGYQSAEFREFCYTLGYRIETSPTRDKHAHGVAERSVGNIIIKTNIAMLGNVAHPCPQTFWPDAILYACPCDGFGYKNKIGTSPYFISIKGTSTSSTCTHSGPLCTSQCPHMKENKAS